jgi:hypothetical protein
MNCNLDRYLEEQWIACLRIAKSANDGTQAQAEWVRTAEAILQRRNEHVSVCKKCKQQPPQVSTKNK